MANTTTPADAGPSGSESVAADDIAPTTWRYLASLPATVRLVECARLFPRIVNRCAELSLQPARLNAYLGNLVVDDRGVRSGFPLVILTELSRLRDHLARSRPDRYKVYDLVRAADGTLSGRWHSSERHAPDAVPIVATGNAAFASVADLFAMAVAPTRAPDHVEVEIYVDGERLLPDR
jgi:hypothetical protein